MKNSIFTLLIASVLLLGLAACAPPPTPATNSQLANPAAVFCQEQGHTYEIRSDEAGNQYGVCIFSDGNECDAWAYFRGECGPQTNASSPDRINLVETADLQRTTRIDILIPGTLSPDPDASQSPRDGTRHLFLSLTDPQRIADIVSALNTPLALGPRRRCLSYYTLQFYAGEAIIQEFGYGCGPEQGGFLRGDQSIFQGKDATTPPAFDSLFRALISSDTLSMTSEPSPAAMTQLVQDNAQFATELYQRLRGEHNLFFSPHSISLALTMTYAGARGETAAQMAQALHFNLPPAQLHAAFAHLRQELAKRSELPEWMVKERTEEERPTGFQLNIVNALWGQQDYPFNPDYVNFLANIYTANLNPIDFAHNPEGARQQINAWVSEQTADKIKDLLPAGSIDALTRLVLTNAIYFKAAWAHLFAEEATFDDTFTSLDGSTNAVPFMHQTARFRYAINDDATAIALPYLNESVAMLIVMPQQFEAYAASLDSARWSEIEKTLREGEVALSMPKFSFESGFALKEALAAMGMPLPFSPEADFSGMTAQDTSLPPELLELHISNVYHKAFVDVNEAGTEAAAATAVVMALKAAIPAQPVTITLDHPFIFAIYDRPTGEILFLGQVVEP